MPNRNVRFLLTVLAWSPLYMSLCLVGAGESHADLPRRPLLGVRLAMATSGEVEIVEVFDNSSAAKAQLQPGDVLVTVAGERVESIPAFLATMKRFAVGERVEYEDLRRTGRPGVRCLDAGANGGSSWMRLESAAEDGP